MDHTMERTAHRGMACVILGNEVFTDLDFRMMSHYGRKCWKCSKIVIFFQEPNKFHYSVSILSECLHILINCSQLSKCYYLNVRRHMHDA